MESSSSPTPGIARATDVLADLDELDSVMGVETLDQQDLKPKQVRCGGGLSCTSEKRARLSAVMGHFSLPCRR